MGGPSPMPVGPALPPAQLEGWELLVGPLTGKSILCLSDRALLVAALAQRCAHACVVSPPRSPGTGSTLPGGEWAWHNVEIVTHDALQARIQSNGLARFDGLVFSRPRVTATPGHVAELPDLLRSIRPALRDGAFVLVVVPNRLGLTSDRVRAGFRSAEAWSSRALLDLVRGMGTSAPTIHPMLIDAEGRISEVLAPTGYRATKNVSLTRERIKQWFWGPRSAHWFAPALACVGWIGPPRPTVIDSVARALARGDGLLHWVQYLVLRSGKVIATFARSRQAGAEQVVVVTRDPLAISRRVREAATLQYLAEYLPTSLSGLLPRVLNRFEVDGNECFVLQRIPGVTADAVVPELDTVTRASLRFLIAVHRATAVQRVMCDDDWRSLLGPIFDSAVARNKGVAAELRELEARVRAQLVSQVWVAVCSHGDFKIENVMYDPQSFEITGVIDWEHALIDGFPYIDLAYLLTYNRMLHGQSWLQAARALLLGNVSAQEALIELQYWEASAVPVRLVPALRALVIVHHIGVRWHGQWAEQMEGDLAAMLSDCIAMVKVSASASAPADQYPRQATAGRGIPSPAVK